MKLNITKMNWPMKLLDFVLYINSLRPSVRPSDATVLRFNPPAESARTVGRTDKHILYGRTGPDRQPLYNFDQRSLVSQSVTVGIKVDISVVLKRVLKKNQISTSNCLELGGSLKFFHPPKLGALFDFANFQIPGRIGFQFEG
jgi:hypothetical protein